MLSLSFLLSGQIPKEKGSPLGYLSQPGFEKLAPRFQEWLNMVAYIATPEEKSVFIELANDRDRELFMRIFWQQRDPTPGTEANEYRQEVEKRFAYVNANFSRGTPKPGWMTDMGRITMILGKPQSIESFANEPGLHPAQVWFFQGEEKLGLPPYFTITFFKRQGMGEWVIYDPVSDGPAALIINSEEWNTSDYRQLYQRIKKLAPTLAQPAISMLPNQTPYGYTPSPQNNLIMSNILRSPMRKINDSYAVGFLNYKGLVSVETSTRYIENAHSLHLWKDQQNQNWFVHFTVKPKKISVDYSRERQKYYFNFKLVSSLKRRDRVIFQQTRNFDLYLDSRELDILQAGGLVIADAFPVNDGDYTLSVFIENQVGREFSYFDADLGIPAPGATPRLLPPFLGHKKTEAAPGNFAPYQFLGQKIAADPENRFGTGDTLVLVIAASGIGPEIQRQGWIEWEMAAAGDPSPPQKKGSIYFRDHPQQPDPILLLPMPVALPGAGYYRMTFRLHAGTAVAIDSKTLDFTLLPVNRISRPTEMYQQVPAAAAGQFPYILGLQLFQLGDYGRAESQFDRSLQANPGFLEGERMLLETYILQKRYDRVIENADRLQGSDQYAFSRHRLKGQAYFGLGRYPEALREFLAANQVVNNDFQLINLIGHSYLNLGNRSEAINAYEASLRLNPDQPSLRKQLEETKAARIK